MSQRCVFSYVCVCVCVCVWYVLRDVLRVVRCQTNQKLEKELTEQIERIQKERLALKTGNDSN
jgi:hypothetical protein